MKNKLNFLLLILTIIIVIIPLGSATESFGVFKQYTNVNLIQTYNASYCNITSITSPNSTLIVSGKLMTKSGLRFNYTLGSSYTSEIGTYIVCGECDKIPWCADFKISLSGMEPHNGGLIIFFSSFLMVCLAAVCILVLYNIGHLALLDFDIVDLSCNFGMYFVIVVLYYLEESYLNDPVMGKCLNWLMVVGGIFFILIPVIAFLVSVTIGSLRNREFKQPVLAKTKFLRREIR